MNMFQIFYIFLELKVKENQLWKNHWVDMKWQFNVSQIK